MTAKREAWARFDDFFAGTACRFPRIQSEIVAHRPDQVAAALAEVERVSAEGLWAFGFVSYEAAAGLDPTLPVHEPIEGLPLVWFGVSEAPERVPLVSRSGGSAFALEPWRYEWTREQHRRAVDAVHRHIAAGETYQCNLTTRLHTEFVGDLGSLYSDVVHAQGGAYNAYLDTGRFVVAGASPELFFETCDNRLLMRPMKGTARRGATEQEDAERVRKLRTSPKERAENIMIVDLVRNDVARLAVVGSVSVRSLCQVETYRTVHQMTSEVTARLRPDVDLLDIFRALFPCGSVTGAPKARTMRLIRDLEPSPRGAYCGAVGVVAPIGTPTRFRFNVAIRTVLADRARGTAVYGTGGGITWDSVAADEYAELQAKSAVVTTSPVEQEYISAPAEIGHLSQTSVP
ncbi:aminodeoxychorismate synthase component I [Nocardia aurea]|uniref:aminodeoxychorismate synthase component I n=1 Tax=Nocardia aurea TaxID=2144174 RepID=UPI000D68DEA8|nr:aminodeoxychorismate synthase component I [Nocardia aurea]